MLELQRFQTLLKLHPIELHATFLKPGPAATHGHCSLALRTLRRPPHLWGWVADVWRCASSRSPARPRRHPRALQPGPVGQVARLSETAIAFARSCARGVEWQTRSRAHSSPARSCARGVETVIAFSGEKWAFLLQFSAALVLLVSMGAVQGRAVVMMVPCWPASVAAEVSLVAKSPRAGSYARKSSPCLI